MAKRIPQSFIDELLNRTDLVALIDSTVSLRKRGASYSACCPFHQEKTPSFHVHPERQFYHCYGCGANGSAISFLMEHDGLTFIETIEELARQAGLSIPQSTTTPQDNAPSTSKRNQYHKCLQAVAQYFQQQLLQHNKAQAYLAERGLDQDVIQRYGIGYAPPGWDNILSRFGNTVDRQQCLLETGMLIKKEQGGYYDRFRDRIMFPIRDRRGQVIAFGGRVLDDGEPKYLNSPETPLYHKGQEIYGLYEARQAQRKLDSLLIVEGYIDVVCLAQYGFSHAVATLGTATTEQHIRQLLRLCSQLTFCFDGDRAGRQAAKRALETALPVINDGQHLQFVLLPDNEDPDSLLRTQGREALQAHLSQQAMPLTDYFFAALDHEQQNDSSLETKAQQAKQAQTWLNKMPSSFLKKLLIEEVSKRTRIDLNHTLQANPPKQAPQSNPITSRRITPMQLAIALLLQDPTLGRDTPLPNTPLDLPGYPLLQTLLMTINSHPDITTGQLLERFRDNPQQTTLQGLSQWQHPLSDGDLRAEFQGALHKICEKIRKQTIQYLLDKLNRNVISPSEHEQLQQLIRAKA